MQLGLVGLGKMGMQIAGRLLARGARVVAHDLSEAARAAAGAAGAQTVSGIGLLPAALTPPRVLWVMVPAGRPTEDSVLALAAGMEAGDVVIDGGNSNYRDSIRLGGILEQRGLGFLDCGTSGGIRGQEDGFCLMIGGGKTAFSTAEPIFRLLAQDGGYLHVGQSGSGHYVKMIHNAVEYALMEAYGEGFELLSAKEEFALDLAAIARLWGKGSIVRSFLLDLAAAALSRDAKLAEVKGYVADSGEGRWAAEESLELGVPAPAVLLALTQRYRSRQDDSFSARLLAALRREFGGHNVIHDKK